MVYLVIGFIVVGIVGLMVSDPTITAESIGESVRNEFDKLVK